MDRRIERLQEMGCDTEKALERMVYDEAFYIECIQEALSNECFEKLGQALDCEAVEQAFDHAHALKGVLGNVGITPLYILISEIVEPLRRGQIEGVKERYTELIAKKSRFAEIF